MYPVALYQLAGLAGAGLFHLLLFAVAKRAGGARWPFLYLTGLVGTASLLAWQALVPAPWLVPMVLAALVAAGGVALWQLARRRAPRPAAAPAPSSRWQKGLEILAAAFLAVDLAWAAFPAYRYDQWNYHLVIPKILASLGSLPLPIYNDHIYFTGVYEYLFTIPRWLWAEDTFNCCFADAFTWLAYVIALAGLLQYGARSFGWTSRTPKLLLAALLFAPPAHESLTNAKPDLLLTPMALACVLLLESVVRRPTRRNVAALGFMLALPLAIKVIWLQFLAAIGLALLIALARRWVRMPLLPFVGGGCTGLSLAVPFLAKNAHFFANPLHPAQVAFFRSVPWVPAAEEHWRVDTGRATSVANYFDILLACPLQLARLTAWFLPALALLAWSHWSRRRDPPSAEPSLRSGRVLGLCLGIFVAIWPIFFDPRHQPRYVDSVFALAMAGCAVASTRRLPAWAVLTALALPVVGNSAVDVKVRKIAASAWRPLADYYRDAPPPLDLHELAREVNEHRSRTFPGAGMLEHIVLADTPALYFLDSMSFRVGQSDWDVVYGQYAATHDRPCLWRFLKSMSVSYVLSYERPFVAWPPAVAGLFSAPGVIEGAETIGAHGALYYLSPETVDQRIAAAADCQAIASQH